MAHLEQHFCIFVLSVFAVACADDGSSSNKNSDPDGASGLGGNGTAAPVLNNISILNFDSRSITLNQPTFSKAGDPKPTVQAYIGLKLPLDKKTNEALVHLKWVKANGVRNYYETMLVMVELERMGY